MKLMNHLFGLFGSMAVLTIATFLPATADSLSEAFLRPPAEARPQVLFHMMDGNISKEGITKDFEAIAAAGIGGVQMMDCGQDMPRGPVTFCSKEFFDVMRHAAKEAKRLGIEIISSNCSGWSSSGGPWITPEKGMKKVVYSEARVSGGGKRGFKLPADDLGQGFYEDIAILAFPTPKRELAKDEWKMVDAATSPRQKKVEDSSRRDEVVASTMDKVEDSSRRDEVVASTMGDGSGRMYVFQSESPAIINGLEFRFEFDYGWYVYGSYIAEASDDGKSWREIGKRPFIISFCGGHDFSLRYHSFDRTETAKFFRVKVDVPDWGDKTFRIAELRPVARLAVSEKNFKNFDIRVDAEFPDVNPDSEGAVALDAVRKLDLKPSADGTCEWEAPEGEWTVLRIGYACNGKKNHPATSAGIGLEVDKLDDEAVAFHFDQFVGRLCQELGPEFVGRRTGVYTGFMIDSFEVNAQNWTKKLPQEFLARTGYDITPYLPALAGHVVGSSVKSDAFLADFRRVIGQLFAEKYPATIARKAHEHDLEFWLQPYGNLPGNGLEYGRHVDVPMGEFWSHGQRQNDDFGSARYASYLAHVWGRKFVGGESFTARPLEAGRWQTTPYSLKRQCDTVYAEGLNKIVYHRYTHQPWTQKDAEPGMTMGMWGIHFERTQTWWPLVGDWISYQTRCQALLQRGTFVADVLFFAGEGYPNNAGYNPEDGTGEPYSLAAGWKFDVCDGEALAALKVNEGRVVVPGGTEYAVLVLPKGGVKDPKLAAAVARLRKEGAEIITDEKPEAALKRLMIARDADIAFKGARFLHRREGGSDWYFVAVPNDAATTIEASFRIGDRRRPELWDAETGERYVPRSWRREAGRVFVDIPVRPNGSMFVVFPEQPSEGVEKAGERAGAYVAARNLAAGKTVKPGKLSFPEVGDIQLENFVDWTTLENFDMRHFSGTATYMFEVPFAGELDLGDVKHFAEVFVGGELKARMWRPPFRCEVPAGEVTVKVTNLWPNRLIGDDYLEPNCEWENWQVKKIPDWVREGKNSPTANKHFTARRHWTKNDPLLPSGILGPVMIREVK